MENLAFHEELCEASPILILFFLTSYLDSFFSFKPKILYIIVVSSLVGP